MFCSNQLQTNLYRSGTLQFTPFELDQDDYNITSGSILIVGIARSLDLDRSICIYIAVEIMDKAKKLIEQYKSALKALKKHISAPRQSSQGPQKLHCFEQLMKCENVQSRKGL